MHSPATILHPPAAVDSQKTVVVFGLYRGGTSMVAGLVRIIGVPMGERIDPANNEDLDFQGASGERLLELIRSRNAKHDVWGWKDPGVARSARDLVPLLRNPRFIVTFRDVLASSQTEVHGGFLPDMATALRVAQDQMSRIVEFVATCQAEGWPVMLISYERTLSQPCELVAELARFLDLRIDAATQSQALEFIDPVRGYGWPDQTATSDSASTVGAASIYS